MRVSKCFFFLREKTVAVYFIVNLGLLLRNTELRHELVVKLLILIGGRYWACMFSSEAALVCLETNEWL